MVCRVCGCHELDACVYSNGRMEFRCWWAAPGLCSFCVLEDKPLHPEASIVGGGHRAVVVVGVSGGLL